MGEKDEKHQEALEALRQLDQLYRTMMDHSLQGLAIVQGMPPQIKLANATLAEMLGYSVKELLAMPAEAVGKMLHPDEDPQMDGYQERLEGIQPTSRRILRFVRKDGQVRRLSVVGIGTVYQEKPAVQVLAIDVTEQQRVEQALKQSEAKYRTLVEQSLQGIVIVQGDPLRIKFINATLAEMVGYSVEELRALSFEQILSIVHAEDRGPIFERYRQRVAGSTAPARYIMRVIRSDRELRWVEVLVSSIEYQGAPATQALFLDITERKQVEQERKEFEAQLQHAQKLESLGLMAGGIAHDFNNILMGILGNADLVLSNQSTVSRDRDCLTEIRDAALRAAGLCNQLLAYSGKGQFEIRALDLNEMVREMGELLALSVGKKTVLKYELAADLSSVEADASQMRQIIMNLITNASESLGENHGLVTISTGQLSCSEGSLQKAAVNATAGEGEYVFVEVIDSGCGMDAETRSRMFDPFFSTKFTGRGLGLAAVLGIVRAHQGAIMVSSEPGKGSVIRVLLPSSKQPVRALLREEPPQETWQGSGTILLVDDERIVHQVTGRMLQKMGFDVLSAHDGQEAVQIFSEQGDDVLLILLDLTMPRMSGEEAFKEIRRIDGDARVILSSGYSEKEAAKRFIGLELAGFIQKPYRMGALQQKLQQVLGHKDPPPTA